MRQIDPPLTPAEIERLIREMPAAVTGPLYVKAREQARAELDDDCREARRILADADAAPRDRAWTRAMLAEAGET
jgi:hypothetical protein